MPLEVSTLRREATPTVIPREVAESRGRFRKREKSHAKDLS
jgi:hypothetical protein